MRHPIQFVGLLALGIALSACGNDSDSAFGNQYSQGQPYQPGSNIIAGSGRINDYPGYSLNQQEFSTHNWNQTYRIGEGNIIDVLRIANERVRVEIFAPSHFEQINIPSSDNRIVFLANRQPPHTKSHYFPNIAISGRRNVIDLRNAELIIQNRSQIQVSGSHNVIYLPCNFQHQHLISIKTQPNWTFQNC